MVPLKVQQSETFSHVLCIIGNILNDNEIEVLSEGLTKSETLKELNLSENAIRDIGARAITNSLMYNTSLVALDLSKKRIHDDGMK